MERRDVYENELTEEDLPSGAQREDAAEELELDPDSNSSDDDRSMEDNAFGVDERG